MFVVKVFLIHCRVQTVDTISKKQEQFQTGAKVDEQRREARNNDGILLSCVFG
jgi:hypothetical protein